ncbi:hypothetical protein E3E12_07825 [Formicincola oecophyllae]|uniref:Uncharacterized protein n=1 Tax=Formicincola oecophyllae TaxID=2558361 RepID=A0A4Y6UA73_9PROT|nr:hypothetical protein [Formicincola oecophyllae]QDH14104.1 hypothetical protein E3E12_07825 [Formicincola oecophyllae]
MSKLNFPEQTNHHFFLNTYVNTPDIHERCTYEIMVDDKGVTMAFTHEDAVDLIDLQCMGWDGAKMGRLPLDDVLFLMQEAEEWLLDDDPELLEDYFKRLEEEEKAAKAENPES